MSASPLDVKKLLDHDHPEYDLDPDLSVADVFVNAGLAAQDGLDQRAAVRVIQKPTPNSSYRCGSVFHWTRASGSSAAESATPSRPPVPTFSNATRERLQSTHPLTSTHLQAHSAPQISNNPIDDFDDLGDVFDSFNARSADEIAESEHPMTSIEDAGVDPAHMEADEASPLQMEDDEVTPVQTGREVSPVLADEPPSEFTQECTPTRAPLASSPLLRSVTVEIRNPPKRSFNEDMYADTIDAEVRDNKRRKTEPMVEKPNGPGPGQMGLGITSSPPKRTRQTKIPYSPKMKGKKNAKNAKNKKDTNAGQLSSPSTSTPRANRSQSDPQPPPSQGHAAVEEAERFIRRVKAAKPNKEQLVLIGKISKDLKLYGNASAAKKYNTRRRIQRAVQKLEGITNLEAEDDPPEDYGSVDEEAVLLSESAEPQSSKPPPSVSAGNSNNDENEASMPAPQPPPTKVKSIFSKPSWSVSPAKKPTPRRETPESSSSSSGSDESSDESSKEPSKEPRDAPRGESSTAAAKHWNISKANSLKELLSSIM